MRKLIGIVVVVAAASSGRLNFAEAQRATSAQPSPSEEDMPLPEKLARQAAVFATRPRGRPCEHWVVLHR